jgi:hypothetical protein
LMNSTALAAVIEAAGFTSIHFGIYPLPRKYM